MFRGDHVRQQRLAEYGVGVLQVHIPERVPLRHQRVFAGDAVHEDVEPVMPTIECPEERSDLGFDRVVDANRNRFPPSGRDQLRGFVDGLRTAIGRRVAAHASTGAVHGGPGLAQRTRDAAPGAARGARYHGHLAGEGAGYSLGVCSRSSRAAVSDTPGLTPSAACRSCASAHNDSPPSHCRCVPSGRPGFEWHCARVHRIRRLEKNPSVPGPIQSATLPPAVPSFKSLTTKAGSAAP